MNKVRVYREKKGFTQFELAKRCNIFPADISKIENGLIKAYPKWRERISRALQVNQEILFSEGEDENEI